MILLKEFDKKSADYKAIKQLYKTAFPSEERAPYFMLTLRAKQGKGDFCAAYDNTEFVGMVYVISDDALAYVFYLAVSEKHRGAGYGSSILTAVKEKYSDKQIFLAIEELDPSAENYEQRINRKHFYEKNGLSLMNCKLREVNMIYDVMGTGEEIEPARFRQLMRNWIGSFFGLFFTTDIIPTKKQG